MRAVHSRISESAILLVLVGAVGSGGSCSSTKRGAAVADGAGGSGQDTGVDAEVAPADASTSDAAAIDSSQGKRPTTEEKVRRVAPPPPPCLLPEPPKLKLTRVVMVDEPPLAVTQPPGDNRLYVAQRHGLIAIVKNGQILPEPFLDMRASVGGYEGKNGVVEGERGLMNLVFHPKYAENGRFYVFYTRSLTDPYFEGTRRKGDVVIAEGRRSANPEKADAALKQLISIQHDGIDRRNGCCDDGHNGGFLAFGPDGHLYAGVGDGGGGGDQYGKNAAGLSTLLRINVEAPNVPVAGGLGAEGPLAFAWAKGVRNPFRGTFDSKTGDLYFSDVGEANWEEINYVPVSQLRAQGLDFGWANPGMEGFRVVRYWPYVELNAPAFGVLPAHEYEHPVNPERPENRLSRAVVGGVVYRGSAIAGMDGRFFFGDYPTNTVSSFVIVEGRGTCVVDHTADLVTAETPIQGLIGFSHPNDDQLYLFDAAGTIYQVEKE